MHIKLSKRSVDLAAPHSGGRTMIFDTEIPGFALRITENGVKTFVLRYSRGGRSRWFTIGRTNAMTPEQARREAIRLRGIVASGTDPAAERAQARAIPTFREFAERYLAEHSALKKKPRSYREDQLKVARYILPRLGNFRLSEIATADVQRLHNQLRHIPTTANRVLAIVMTMMNFAERWGYLPSGSNPTRYVEKFPEARRERLLSPDELGRLGDALREAAREGANPSAIACIQLLVLTGCRLGEILNLRWEHVDVTAGCLRLPDSKTGAKVVPLGAPAVDLLRTMPRLAGNPFVCPGVNRGSAFVGIGKPWRDIRSRAGLADLRIHDLRHAFASTGLQVGESLAVIGRLLGHSTPTMTARYAHLAPDPARAAADRISRAQRKMLGGSRRSSGIILNAARLGRRNRNKKSAAKSVAAS